MKSKKKEYGSIRFYHPDGTLMFVSNQTKANWYLSRNLAKIIEQENEEVKSVQFTIVPKGYGQNIEFYLTPLKNICVVCGEDNYELLTRHHVFPECYKKHLPEFLKSKNHYDLFRMCGKHHDEYEVHAQKLKKQIAEELGVVSIDTVTSEQEKEKRKLPGFARILLENSVNLPEKRKQFLFEEIKRITGTQEVSEEILKKLCENQKRARSKKENPELLHGYQVMRKTEDVQAFAERWRKHFLEYAKPNFLPENWKVDEKIYIKEEREK